MYDDYPDDSTTTGFFSLAQDAFGRFDQVDIYDEYFYDADWFRIELEARQLYQFRATTSDPVYIALSIHEGPVIVEHEQDGFEGFAQLTITAEQTGSYFVQAANLIGESEGDYRIVGNLYEIPESEFTLIDLPQDVARQFDIETPFDRDFVRVELNAGWTYEIKLAGADSSSGTLANPNLRVYSDEVQLLATQNNGGTNRDSRLAFTARDDGVYYLSASGIGAGTGTYEISYSLLSYVDDAPTGPTTTVEVPVKANQTTFIDGSIEVGTDIDWYKVNLVAGRWYQLAGGNFLRDPDGQIVHYMDGYTFYQPEQTGTYHWVVRNRAHVSRNYRLIIRDNMPIVISTRSNQFDLTESESLTLANMFSLNGFPADHVQVFAEADFTIGSTQYEAWQLHTLTPPQMSQALFDGESRRGEYNVKLRARQGATFSGWAQANIFSARSAAFLVGQGNIWNSANTQRGSDNVITYRFADSVPSYFEIGRFSGFEMVSQGVQDLFDFIFGYGSYPEGLTSWMPQISNYAGLRFEYDDSERADIQIFAADSTRPATGYRPGMYGFGDIVLDNTLFGGTTSEPQPGDERYFQILRAVGSALGIKHWVPGLGRDATIMGAATTDPLPQSFGYWDTEFLREQYGESLLTDPTHWGREDRLGYWSEPFFRTINRQSPANEINASYSDQPVTIDLRQGKSSFLENRSQVFVIGKRQIVERATGSDFDDRLTGNSADNRMVGDDGNDQFAGKAGNDTLLGGRGDDTYFYQLGEGHDIVQETGSSRTDGGIDTLQITGYLGFDSIENDLTFRRAGNDLLIDLDLNGQFNRYNGKIRIKQMGYVPWQVERLDLRNFSSELGVYSLVSIWNSATSEKQRFFGTGQADEFGQIATPVA